MRYSVIILVVLLTFVSSKHINLLNDAKNKEITPGNTTFTSKSGEIGDSILIMGERKEGTYVVSK